MMGVLPRPSARGQDKAEASAAEGREVQGAEFADRERSEALKSTVKLILSRFDVDDKDVLAKELAQALELGGSDSLVEVGLEILEEDAGKTDTFRLQILSRVLQDQNLLAPEPPFPDDFGAPKADL